MAKVLVVLDGGYRFGDGATPAGSTDFTYIALLQALAEGGHVVTKAHRQSDSTADLQGFSFAGATALLQFDVMWLIGLDGRNSVDGSGSSGAGGISDAEIARIAAFMDAGGGVFATGDHDSIGAHLCGRIPRVRAMRCWYGPNDRVPVLSVLILAVTKSVDSEPTRPLADFTAAHPIRDCPTATRLSGGL